ncbi:MAG: radical SAM family heme chaperone HemW [Gammaproteobacteria bacterium]
MPPAPPLALYAHFPWCVKKCPYCDFNSHAQRGDIDQNGYVDALLRDLGRDLAPGGIADAARGRKLHSIFLGGGTPSLFGGDAMARLLRGLRAQLDWDAGIEITLEANPGALEHDDFRAYRAAGINRISLGVQSFQDARLREIGRIHSGADARRAIRAALDAGFDNVNLDLMFALPRQLAREALRDLDAAIDFAPRHLSLYQLTLEPQTWFHRHPPPLPGEAQAMTMQRELHARAAAHGYHRYEVSAHARRGGRCRHNLNYWEFGDYLGIGAGAHGKITRDLAVTRYWKRKHPQGYLAALGGGAGDAAGGNAALGGSKVVARAEVLFEFLLNALRLRDGFAAELAAARAGHSADDALAALGDARARGWVVVEDGRVRCSEKGYWFLDEILQGVLPG